MRVEAATVASREILVEAVFLLELELCLRQHVSCLIGTGAGEGVEPHLVGPIALERDSWARRVKPERVHAAAAHAGIDFAGFLVVAVGVTKVVRQRNLLVQAVVSTLCLLMAQLGESVRAGYQIMVDMTLIVTFIPFLYIFGAGLRFANRMFWISPVVSWGAVLLTLAASACLYRVMFKEERDAARAIPEVAQEAEGADGAWVHAYLHRKEGDEGNAGYWYRRAGRPVGKGDLDAEWEQIVGELLARGR